MIESPGMKPNDDYIEMPYLEGWQPVSDRRWALAYMNEDGSEDFEGFQTEYLQRYPAMEMPGGYPASIPATVDDFVRRDRFGRRQDIDWELARLPLTEEESEAMEKARNDAKRRRRLELLESRGKSPITDPDEIALQLMEREERTAEIDAGGPDASE